MDDKFNFYDYDIIGHLIDVKWTCLTCGREVEIQDKLRFKSINGRSVVYDVHFSCGHIHPANTGIEFLKEHWTKKIRFKIKVLNDE